MDSTASIASTTPMASTDKIKNHATLLSGQLQRLRHQLYPPEAQKVMRTFSSLDASKLLGIAESTLRQMSLDGEGPEPARLDNGRRVYTLEQIHEVRRVLGKKRPNEPKFSPARKIGKEKIPVLAVSNFKGGSAKTTTTVHLAQFLALQGYRVLGIDLDPQASFTSMFGCQPEFDVGYNETLYAAIRYDEDRKPMRDVIRKTYISGLDIVPGNLELMEFEHDTPRAINSGIARGNDIFFRRVASAIEQVEDDYDIILIDTPPQLGYLTLGALFAATGLLITVHPAMLDVASMSQFLLMTSDILSVIEEAGGSLNHDFIKYIITRHNPHDVPQVNVVTLLRSLFQEDVLLSPVLETTAIANAGLEKKSLYELEKGAIRKATYQRALESVDNVNQEVLNLVHKAWGRL